VRVGEDTCEDVGVGVDVNVVEYGIYQMCCRCGYRYAY